jgi:hypothetical protein
MEGYCREGQDCSRAVAEEEEEEVSVTGPVWPRGWVEV